MPAAIIPISEDPPMTIRDSQFNDLQERVNDISERIAHLEGSGLSQSRSNYSPLIVLLSAAAIVVTVVCTGIAATHIIDSEISTRYGALDSRLTKAEGAIKALASQQSSQTQQLVQSLLAAAKTSTPETASRAVSAAASITKTLRDKRVPASPQFFQTAMADLNIAEERNGPPVFDEKIALAEYRSSLLKVSVPPSAFYCTGEAAQKESFSGNFSFSELTLVGCVVTLDGRNLDHVALVNARIIYKGGPLRLNHVLFVNCTFEVQHTDNGSSLLEYAALDKRELTLHPDS